VPFEFLVSPILPQSVAMEEPPVRLNCEVEVLEDEIDPVMTDPVLSQVSKVQAAQNIA